MRVVALLLALALLGVTAAAVQAAPRKRCGKPRACRGVATATATTLPTGWAAAWTLPAKGIVPGPATPGGSTPPPPPPPPPPVPESNPRFLSVKADDTEEDNWHLFLSRPTVLTGAVTVELNNRYAADPHDLRFRRGGSTVFSIPEIDAGATRDATFTMTAGSYTLFCGLPGHEAAGMKATLTVVAG